MLWKSRVNCFEVCLACKTTLEYNCFLARLASRDLCKAQGVVCLLEASYFHPHPSRATIPLRSPSLIHFPNWLYVRLRRLKFHHPNGIARTQDGFGIGTRHSLRELFFCMLITIATRVSFSPAPWESLGSLRPGWKIFKQRNWIFIRFFGNANSFLRLSTLYRGNFVRLLS